MDKLLMTEAAENAQDAAQPAQEGTSPSGDTGWTITKRYRGCAYDVRGIEAWLSERAAKGERLIAWNEFRTGSEKCRCRFYLEIAAKKNEAPDEDLCRRRAARGWEYVCTTGNGIFHVWRGDASAQRPAMQDYSDSYGYRKLRRARIINGFFPLLYLLMIAVPAWIICTGSEMPLRALLLMEKTVFVQGVGLILSGIFAVLSNARDQKNLRTLLRAMEEGEHVDALPRDRWAKLDRIMSGALLLISFILIFAGADGNMDWTSEQPSHYVSAEAFGGKKAEEYMLREQSTPLGGSVRAVSEGHYAGRVDGWYYHDTELTVFTPRIAALAQPLAGEMREYFMPHAQEVFLPGADEAYYADEGAQFLLLRCGGSVLFYRTTAPDDLRQSLDVFVQVLKEYEEK